MKNNYVEKIVEISNIQLDQENPRFPPVESQREAIQAMLRDQGNKIVNLASDIYRNGLNPSSKLILFKDKGKYVDGDGNRRVTVLKILETPSLSDFDPKIRRKIDRILKGRGEIPSQVDCVVFESREAAKHWISINHSGPQDGKGQISWDYEQKNRFEGNFTIGLQALDLLTYNKMISDEDKSRVKKSTLDRLLSYKAVKKLLVIEKSSDRFSFGSLNNLKKVVLALRDQKVDIVYTAEKGTAFVESVLNGYTDNSSPGNSDGTSDEGGETVSPTYPENPGTDGFSGSQPDSGQEESSAGSEKASDKDRPVPPRTRRKQSPGLLIFGGSLALKPGHINNLYRDIEHIYKIYKNGNQTFSNDFVVIFRMSLRMLAETAGREFNKELKDYLLDNFDQAKKSLNTDERTSLSSQSVEKGKIVQLFQTGAHDYANSRNEEQAVALSVILGAILKITHGKDS